ncbi:serine/threonine-protein phosphatase 4 regulatory subunit 2-B isoform X2 [Halichoeres trimaculatus]|uniref:serine/threonine-protein phosphatase 4 regulatory subunit 2-B isoform X2 n=1 Tax=Halichoeres trimaculatus TaxID=147232 RepID=UPI003D9E10C9
MEIGLVQEALKDFDKKAKMEASPLLEQFLCHIAKTGETMIQWSQFKNYFLFKLEKVMDDFRASAPEQKRGPANPNMESVSFEDMKGRILKIVKGYNGIPFTIQRLCELLTEPKRNYTGTDKFLRGVEKNVMVVSCIHPTVEKNGCSAVNRINGLMLPGITSAFIERKVNGPGTPRPLNRPKVSIANTIAANGLPASSKKKDLKIEHGGDNNLSEAPSACGTLGNLLKNKHPVTENDVEAELQEVKRLKFSEEEEDVEQEVDTLRPLQAPCPTKGAETMTQAVTEEDKKGRYSKDNQPFSSPAVAEEAEPTGHTQAEVCTGSGQDAEPTEREVPCGSQEDGSDMDQTEQQSRAQNISRDSHDGSSSTYSTAESAEESIEDLAQATSSSPTEGAMERAGLNTGTSKETKQD